MKAPINWKSVSKEVIISLFIVFSITGTYAALSSLTATNGESLTATKWNDLVYHATPSGAVMAFDLVSCPTGWTEYTAARGRTLIGAGQGNTAEGGALGTNWSLGTSTGSETYTLTTNEIPSHRHATHQGSNGAFYVAFNVVPDGSSYPPAGPNSTYPTEYQNTTFSEHTGYEGGGQDHTIMQPSLVLLYCKKD